MEYEYEGNLAQSHTYGNANEIDMLTLVNRGSGTPAQNEYFVDEKGLVFVNAVKHEKAPLAAASCQYMAK